MCNLGCQVYRRHDQLANWLASAPKCRVFERSEVEFCVQFGGAQVDGCLKVEAVANLVIKRYSPFAIGITRTHIEFVAFSWTFHNCPKKRT